MASRTFVMKTPYVARSVEEFRDLLGRVSVNTLYFHIFEAKLRLEKDENDFSQWLRDLGKPVLADQIARLDPYTYTMEGLRNKLIQLVDNMVRIEDYIPIVGQPTIDELFHLSKHLEGKHIQNINSTAVGGGVAEILTRMIPLLNQLGVMARWDVIKGNEKFFVVTKKFHNGLHGVPVDVSKEEYDWFLEVNRENAAAMSFDDIVFVHDPQPVALIERRNDIGKNWIWRCHIDFSRPDKKIWRFLEQYITRYDAAVFCPFVRTKSLDPTDSHFPFHRPAERQEQGTSGRCGGQDFRSIQNRPIPAGRNTDIPI